jgi:hypothetical protein
MSLSVNYVQERTPVQAFLYMGMEKLGYCYLSSSLSELSTTEPVAPVLL